MKASIENCIYRTKTRWRYYTELQPQWTAVFAVTYTGYVTIYLLRKVSSVAKPFIKEVLPQIDLVNLGKIDSSFFVTYASFQIFSGAIASRIGRRSTLCMAFVLCAISAIGFGLSDTSDAMIAFWALQGVGHAPVFSCFLAALTESLPKERLGSLTALWTTSQQVGAILSSLWGTWLCDRHGWQWAYFAPSFIFLAFPFLLYRYLPDRVEESKRDDVIVDTRHDLPSLSSTLKIKGCIPASLIYSHVKLIRYCLLFWLPTIFVETTKVSSAMAGYGSVLFDISGIFGSIMMGSIIDRYCCDSKLRPGPYCFVLLFVLLIMMSRLVASTSDSEYSNVNFVLLLMMTGLVGTLVAGVDVIYGSMSPSVLCHNHSISTGDTRDYSTSIIGIINGIGSVGGFAQGYLTPKILAKFDHRWDCLIAFLGINALCALTLCKVLDVNSPGNQPIRDTTPSKSPEVEMAPMPGDVSPRTFGKVKPVCVV